ncbi:right-handed parallel beta-helix repeat-containing protein [Nocardioides stalactiti]|uniref:right-handed parallel beta-helix repeat-containing protein n=1 Tax=Nocardioides stalactiti TaxID=2755356 RepID=UPI0015FFC9D5|nr:right-handed parallel beta-helix repeat-containing protein [Nocardioides stalactiti]
MPSTSTTVLTVTSTGSSGPGTFRDVIDRANATVGEVLIEFDLGLDRVIRPSAPLPALRFVGVIDGGTAPDAVQSPGVEVCGTAAEAGIGLEIVGGPLELRGITVTDWPDDGILIHDAEDVTVLGAHVGVRQCGRAMGNGGTGIHVLRSVGIHIGGPAEPLVACSGNGAWGIRIQDSPGARLDGLRIGTDADGRRAIGNGRGGVRVERSPRVMIGHPGGLNVISGNNGPGVVLHDGSEAAVLTGSHIGTDADGLRSIPNTTGVTVTAPRVLVGSTDNRDHGAHAAGAPVGSGDLAAGNLISGNLTSGIAVIGEEAADVRVAGNRIGTDHGGARAVPNGGAGVSVYQAPRARIGGATANQRNVIAGNGLYGIQVAGPLSRGAAIVGNHIGTDLTGTTSIPNIRSGILVFNAMETVIGGADPTEGNLISGGARAGVNLDGSVMHGLDYEGKGHAHSNLVQGNTIGLDRTGERPLANAQRGVLINYAQGNTVCDNLIGGNGEDGVLVLGPGYADDAHLVPTGNVIVRNRIGVSATGSAAGNGRCGVLIYHGRDNRVGGDDPSEANVIAHNASVGVLFHGLGARTNRLSPHEQIDDNTLGRFHQSGG